MEPTAVELVVAMRILSKVITDITKFFDVCSAMLIDYDSDSSSEYPI